MHIEGESLYDLTHDLILEIGIQGQIGAANLPMCEALGYARSDLTRMRIQELVAVDSHEECETCLETALGDVPVQGANLTLLDSQGGLLRVEASFHPRKKGKESSIYVFFRSLTEQQQVRQALRESERRLRTILSAVPDVLIVLDQRGRYRQIYTANTDMLVAPVDHLIGKKMSDILPHDNAEFGMRTLVKVIKTQEPAQVEYCLEIGGRSKWFSGQVVPFGSERDPCVLWVARDISSLIEARRQLEEDQQLLRSLLELETKAREVVAYEIHDGFVQYAIGTQMWLQNVVENIDQLPPPTASAIEIALESIKHAVEDARSMIRELRPVIIDEEGIANGLNQLIDVMQRKTEMPIGFVCETIPPPMLKLLEGQIFRIVQESLTNAIRHSEASEVTVWLGGDSSSVQVDIVDNGKGFDPDDVPPDRYGLEGIQRRASVFGGISKVIARPGGGTHIKVTLPIIRRKEHS